jgi:GH15 family glucan-1,4-alpha-glucosidase
MRQDGAIALRIEDYALIGDTQTAALVGTDGSIDWLCFPRFDSAACFASLLGDESNGRWLIAPAGGARRVTREYRTNTLVLETEFETDEGRVKLVDCMPPRDVRPDVVRMVEGVTGRVSMRMELVIRFDYGRTVPWVRRRDDSLLAVAGPDALTLRTPVTTVGEDLTTLAEFAVSEGDRVPFVLGWHPSHESSPGTVEPLAAVSDTTAWWREWADRCEHRGEWQEAVMRSMVTLKALTYAPTGGIVAAATTSLPEHLGGVRNWDYRYCWLRDATLTLHSLLDGGYTDEARAWRDWLLRAVAGSPGDLQIMYGAAGERRLTELELDWLPGYEASAPVRVGNAAVEQFQLDVFGEVMDTLEESRSAGIGPDPFAWELQLELLDHLESAWREPDEGIWEIRGERRQFTHSKVMAWVAMDRAIRAVETHGVEGPVDHWRDLRAAIHDEVCRKGFDAERGTFVQHYDTREVDAGLLMIPLVGFLPPQDPRVAGTIHAVQEDLLHNGLLLRYRTEGVDAVDGLPPGEGAFLPCSFWLVCCLAMIGRVDEARRLFERLLSLRNDVGLLSESYDSEHGRLVGNFPQAFTHVALVRAAGYLDRASGHGHRRSGSAAGSA